MIILLHCCSFSSDVSMGVGGAIVIPIEAFLNPMPKAVSSQGGSVAN